MSITGKTFWLSGEEVADYKCNTCDVLRSETSLPWVYYPELDIHICAECVEKAYKALYEDAPQDEPSPITTKKKIPAALRWAIWERDNFTCQVCGARKFLEVDHIIPESKGGKLEIDNCQTLCRKCNRKKGSSVGAGVDE